MKHIMKIPQPPFSEDGKCPNCGEFHPRRTHETDGKHEKGGSKYILCRCQECWAVYWAANVHKLSL